MLFNSYIFIFAFLPVTFFVYFALNNIGKASIAKGFLVCASLFFYSWWKVSYLPIILTSLGVNFLIGNALKRTFKTISQKQILITGIAFNVCLLGFFKYADFFIANVNAVAPFDVPHLNIILPLAISFFTFQQIAYLVDNYKGIAKEHSFLDYSLFVTFFPQLIAGPIVHHKEMMPQFASHLNHIKKYQNIALGLFIFSMGLFKKTVIADTFATWATPGFDGAASLNFFEAWSASLSYTFQLYFDFSAYTDMAIGAALLFNIKLPINFNSPYKALSIQDFWRRWHITLSRFLRDYIYIPLGGNKGSISRVCINVFLVFLIGGLWHGASWMFVIWGALHGVAMIVHRLWQRLCIKLPTVFAWFLTFNFVNITWVFFRAKDMDAAVNVLSGMFGLQGIMLPQRVSSSLSAFESVGIQFGPWLENINGSFVTIFATAIALVFCLVSKNTMEIKLENNIYKAVLAGFLLAASFAMLSRPSEFLYFNF